MSRLRLLQVCNVGEIVGGTTACAWTVTRALPEFEHVVAFLSHVTPETQTAFHGARVERWRKCTPGAVDAVRPDVVILHNIDGGGPLGTRAVTLQYVHSAGVRAPADVTVCCSRWLAAQVGRSARDVLYQGVPRPPRPENRRERGADGRLVIGRLCTPVRFKWPAAIVPFYVELAARCPDVEWEFVGCPQRLRDELIGACSGRARFFPAGWTARSRLWEWDALLYHHPTITESFGRTAAESLRAGCIPIVDARGGFVEQVTSETGFVCGTVDAFADRITKLRDTELRQRMSAAGRELGDRRFSIGRFGERLRMLIRDAAMMRR